jgi:SAM-dependent methyltransferase
MALLSEAMLRRVARHCAIGARTQVLVLGSGGGVAAALLAKGTGANVVAADSDPEAVQKHRVTLREHGVEDRVRARRVDYHKLPFADGEFEAILLSGHSLPLDAGARALRRHLSSGGRLCAAYPVRVGRHPNPAVVRLWEQRAGVPLQPPSECLQTIERAGFEPQTAEVLDDAALDAYYRQLEQSLRSANDDAGVATLREEVALFRSQGGRSSASLAVLVARRREPGQKPAPSRSE